VNLVSDTVLHVLDDQVGRAEIHKSANCILSREQTREKLNELILATIGVNQVLVRPNDLVTLLELWCSVLLTHILAELLEVTARDVDHILLADGTIS